MPRISSSRANRSESKAKQVAMQQHNMKPIERNSPEKVIVNSQNIQVALQSFINRHRSSLQKLMEQNNKLGQQNALLNVQLSNQQGTVLALNEKITAGNKEITKYKEEQTRLMESKSLLRTELLTYKKRYGELLVFSEKELKECGEREEVMKNELDAIRKELQDKRVEFENNNAELIQTRIGIKDSKLQLEQLQKSFSAVQNELAQKDQTIIGLRKEHADYKTETEKTINKMREIQHIFYPNATNPLPHIQRHDEGRATQPVSITVQPRPQSRAALKRTSSSSSSDTDEDERVLMRGWRPTRIIHTLPTRAESARGSTEIPPTSESSVEQTTRTQRRLRRN
ncbi:interaptin-like [Zeugodacus cucurbitae]|uniref:interaptin-like n=1 Tax=Zeugodacus cucurbitae TaxID=28588 RepID=UPI0023D9667D|nr:interaptin-like [Zeugodacus cucurbitae]